jgi:site-specific DNA-methyltransferase (adenine-specific)
MLKIKKSTTILGDALDVMAQLPTHSFDHCIVDPPYNMSKKKGLSWAFSKHVTMQESWDRFTKEDYFTFCQKWMAEICRLVKPNGNLFVFGTFHNIYTLGVILEQMDRRIVNSIIWMKPNAQPNITCRMLTESTEQIIWACNETNKRASQWIFNYALGKTLNEGKQMRNAWNIPVTPRSERVAGHPSQKPEVLIERIVLLFSKRGDWILDPFAGVGTTGYVAQKNDRNSVLIENQSRYIEAQKERFQKGGMAQHFRMLDLRKKKSATKKQPKTPSITGKSGTQKSQPQPVIVS